MAKTKGNTVVALLNSDGLKTVNPGDVDSYVGWTMLSGGPATEDDKSIYSFFAKVPWLRRGVNIISTGVATMPFTITAWKDKEKTASDKELDNSDEYQNVVGFLPSPQKILWLMAASRQLTGRAYLFKSRNVYDIAKGLKYLLPTSVKPKYGESEKDAGEVIGWTRTILTGQNKTQEVEFKLEDILYSWYADPYTEVGPPKHWPALNALASAGVLLSLDEQMTGFFKGGMVKQTVFTVPSNTQKEERERIGNILTRMLAGVRNLGKGYEAKVFNADTLEPVVIGEGLENLNDGGLAKQKREDIAAAFGIPSSKLFSTEAGGLGGGGVVEQDDKNFLTETLIPEAEAIFEDLNEQVFHPNKYHIEVNRENIDAFQEDEKERSVAVSQLTSSISVNPLAFELSANIMGYDLTDDQKKLLEAIKSDKQAQRQLFQQRVDGFGNQPQEFPRRNEPEDDEKTLKELSQWQRQALRVGGERSAVEFQSEHVSDDAEKFLRACLPAMRTDKNIKALFAVVRQTKISGTVAAATKAALAKSTTAKKVDAVLADLVKGHE